MRLFRLAVLPVLGIGLSIQAGEPPAVPDAAASVSAVVQALRGDALATWFDALPEAQRVALTGPPPAADAGRGGRRGDGMLLRMLGDEQRAAQTGQLLGAILAQLAVASAPEPAAAPAQATAPVPEDQRMLMFVPRMIAGGAYSGLTNAILASGLETRQIAAIDGLADSFRAWTATAGLADPARAIEAQKHLLPAIAALRSAGEQAVPLRESLVAVSTAMPHLKRALLAYGFDLDGILATAVATLESESAARAVVVVRFTAWGSEHALPLAMQSVNGTWTVVADSPALRWFRPTLNGGMPGGRGPGGRGQPRPAPRPEVDPVPADPPATAPPRQF